jgi:hypothetical protein
MMYLLDRGVHGWSWDAPFIHTAKRFEETGGASIICEGT